MFRRRPRSQGHNIHLIADLPAIPSFPMIMTAEGQICLCLAYGGCLLSEPAQLGPVSLPKQMDLQPLRTANCFRQELQIPRRFVTPAGVSTACRGTAVAEWRTRYYGPKHRYCHGDGAAVRALGLAWPGRALIPATRSPRVFRARWAQSSVQRHFLPYPNSASSWIRPSAGAPGPGCQRCAVPGRRAVSEDQVPAGGQVATAAVGEHQLRHQDCAEASRRLCSVVPSAKAQGLSA